MGNLQLYCLESAQQMLNIADRTHLAMTCTTKVFIAYLIQIKDPRESSSGCFVDQKEHGPLAADQGQHVREDPVDGVVDGALLLEDHPGQVQENLIALDLKY